ncbi:hypothetical protein OG301_38975 (plasmid) [Streptomyces platensis]|uniref:hypothetical protein n=1 Tax=Streptomyces platensis TaxID=58346 RepID=UPI002ED19C4C|nr:hypothetical protein OG301_38975 [Streptomyces platensis]
MPEPETKPSPGVELAEFVAAIAIAGVAGTAGYLLTDHLPFLLAVALVGGTAFGLTALVSAGISRKEARR